MYTYSNRHFFISGDDENGGPPGLLCGQRGGDSIVPQMPRNRNNERDQYKEAICTLNTKLTTKLTQLEKETCYCKELEKTATNLMTELAALHEQMDKAKANTVAVFQIS